MPPNISPDDQHRYFIHALPSSESDFFLEPVIIASGHFQLLVIVKHQRKLHVQRSVYGSDARAIDDETTLCHPQETCGIKQGLQMIHRILDRIDTILCMDIYLIIHAFQIADLSPFSADARRAHPGLSIHQGENAVP